MTKRLKAEVCAESEEGLEPKHAGSGIVISAPGSLVRRSVPRCVREGRVWCRGQALCRRLPGVAGLHVGALSSNQWGGEREGKGKGIFSYSPSAPGICPDTDVSPRPPLQA